MFPLNPKLDWGPSTSDARHIAMVNASYDLPFGPGKEFAAAVHGLHQKLISGWTLSGVETVQSGLTFTPQLGFNRPTNGDSRNPIRPSWKLAFSGPVIRGGPRNTSILPPSGTYGNAGVQFRAEFFDVFNRANFGTPNAVVYTSATAAPSPTAGVITSTTSTSRQTQFGMKLLW